MNGRREFGWTRPPGMAMSDFQAFTAEAEASVGAGNAALLALVDAALNDPCPLPACLAMDGDAASRFAASPPG